MALEGGCETAGGSGSASGSASPEGSADARAAADGGAGQYTFLIRPAELVHLVPALRLHIASTHPTRFDIIEAAWRAAASLGIPQRLWGDACVALGRYNAALAIAVVTSKPTTYFTSSPPAYLPEWWPDTASAP